MADKTRENCQKYADYDALIALALEKSGDSEHGERDDIVGENADDQDERRESHENTWLEINWSSEKMNAEPKPHFGPNMKPIRQTGSIESGVTEPPNGISKILKRLSTNESAMRIAHSTMVCSFEFFINSSEN